MQGDEYTYFDKNGCRTITLKERPGYCNRGKYNSILDIGGVSVSDADNLTRYYFNLDYGKSELLEWLRRHGVNVEGGHWVHLRYNFDKDIYGEVGSLLEQLKWESEEELKFHSLVEQ